MSNDTSFSEGSGNFYTFGARRIGRYLAEHSLPVPDEQALRKALLDHFDGVDYLTAKRLLEKDDSFDWHMVVAGDVDSDLSGYPVQAARNFTEALASVLEICDRERIFPTAIDYLPGGIRLRVHDKVFTEIRRIPFEHFQSGYSQRVQTALKGVRATGESERIEARLRSVPGFASIGFRLDQDRVRRDPKERLLLPFPANWATAMMYAMKVLEMPVKRHVAQELVARLFGASNWQHFVAYDGKARVGAMPYAVATNSTDTATWRYFRTAGESVWALGRILESWNGEPLLIDRCGTAYLTDGLLITTEAVSGDSVDGDGLPFSTPVGLIDSPEDDSYFMLAEQVAATLAAGGNPMVILGWGVDHGQNMFAANLRLGSPGDQTLQLGDWWLRVFKAHERAYLSLEQFRADGTRLSGSSIALYKATLRHDEASGVLTVVADYDREDVAKIPNVSADQCEQLRGMIAEPDNNPAAPASWGRGDIRGEWPPLAR